ncbi:hypothetical protein LB503_012507, partial [Fusarium chuoi]
MRSRDFSARKPILYTDDSRLQRRDLLGRTEGTYREITRHQGVSAQCGRSL